MKIQIKNRKQLKDTLYAILAGAYGSYEIPDDLINEDLSISGQLGIEVFGRYWGAICQHIIPHGISWPSKPQYMKDYDTLQTSFEKLENILF